MGVWFSCLTQTSAPVRSARRGQAICGVGSRIPWTNAAASSNAARVGKGMAALLGIGGACSIAGTGRCIAGGAL